MACRRSLEYVTALATIAMALALIAFAISVTNLNRNNREGKENNYTTTIVDATQRKQMENNSETQLLTGTTTIKGVINSTIKPSEILSSTVVNTPPPTTNTTTTTSTPLTKENIHIVLPTINSVVTTVTSNILPVDDDVDVNDGVVVIDNSFDEFSTTTLTSAIHPSTIEVIKQVILKMLNFSYF